MKHNSTLAVLFPTLAAALMVGAVELGADPMLLVITSPLVVAYPFLWAVSYIFQE